MLAPATLAPPVSVHSPSPSPSPKAHYTQCPLTTLHPCDCVDTDGIEWPTYSAKQRNLVRIETPANIIQDDSLGFCDFWDSIGYVHPCSRLLLLLPLSLSSSHDSHAVPPIHLTTMQLRLGSPSEVAFRATSSQCPPPACLQPTNVLADCFTGVFD